jgi:hypothetical protein
MNKKETTGVMALIKAAYPRYYQHQTAAESESAVALWLDFFRDYPTEVVVYATQEHIKGSQYPPSVAEVLTIIKAAQEANEPTADELWHELGDACGFSGRAELEANYEALSPIVKMFVGGARGLYEIACLDDATYFTVTRGQFYKHIENNRAKIAVREQTPPKIKNLLASLVSAKRIGL